MSAERPAATSQEDVDAMAEDLVVLHRRVRAWPESGLVRVYEAPQDNQEAMGMDWTTLEELSEAVPPAYTEYVGAQLLAYVRQQVAA